MTLKAPRWADALIAVSVYVLSAAGARAFAATVPDIGVPLDARGYAIIGAVTLPLAWRHSYPRLVLWLTVGAWMAYVALGYPDSANIFGPVIAMYSVALYAQRSSAIAHGVAVLAVMSAWTATGIALGYQTSPLALLQLAVAMGLPFAIGLSDSRRAARVVELEYDQRRREETHRIAAADAVRAERARIARELHDVVAHEMTVMTLQAEGARRRPDLAPPTVQVLTTIAESGRAGLAEMQRVIGVLRASEQEATDEVAELTGQRREVPTTLEPAPSLSALPQLAAQVRDAGLPVVLTVENTAAVPASVELTAFRIVQEALTNALKYAGPDATATVTVRGDEGALTVTVDDDGHGVISDVAHRSGGYGLAGMRERVNALGGTLDVGPRRGGGFHVKAVLSLTDAHRRGGRTLGKEAQ